MLADAASQPTTSPASPGPDAAGDHLGWLALLLHPLTMRIWWQWVLVSLVAGIGAELILVNVKATHSIEKIVLTLGPLLTIILVVSVAQAVILRYTFSGWLWWLATIPAGLMLTVLTNVALIRPLSEVLRAAGPFSNDLATAVEVVIISAWIGSLQAMLLAAGRVPHASRWPLGVLLGIGGGVLAANALALPFLGEAATFALVCGAVTGTAICWLLPHAAPAGTGFGAGVADPVSS